MKKVVYVLLASIFMLAGCQTGGNTSTKEVRILSAVTGGKDEAEMQLFVEELMKETGLKIVMEKPASDYNDVLKQKMQAGEVYDLVYINQEQMYQFIEQGILQEITEDVKKSDVLSKNIDALEWEQITYNDKIYAGFNKKEVHRAVNVNEVIAQQGGIASTTIEPTQAGYYELFKSMKASQTAPDFYPFNAVIKDLYDLQPWFAEASLQSGVVEVNGVKTVPYLSDEAIPTWEWLNTLYKEGLLDPNSLVDSTKELRSKFQSGKTGVVVDWAAWTGLYNVNAKEAYPKDFRAVPLPGTQTSTGEYMLTRGGASLWGIPTNSKNKEGALKVLEFFATQKGGELLSIGINEHDYKKENEKVELTEVGKTHGADHGAPVPIYNKFARPIAYNPGFEDAMAFIKYAKPEAYVINNSKYKEIMGKYAIAIVKGDMSPKDGIEEAKKELKQQQII